MTLGQRALAVLVGLFVAVAVWFALWLGATVADTNAKTTEMHSILSGLSSARDVHFEQRGRANAANIQENSNRLDELERR